MNNYPLPQYKDYLAFRTQQLRLEVHKAALLEEFPMDGCCLRNANDDGYSCPECGHSFDSDDLATATEMIDIKDQLKDLKLQRNLAESFSGLFKLQAEMDKEVSK